MVQDRDWGNGDGDDRFEVREPVDFDIRAYAQQTEELLLRYGIDEEILWLTHCSTVTDFEDQYGQSDWGLEGYKGVVYFHESGSVMSHAPFNTELEFHLACRYVANSALHPRFNDHPPIEDGFVLNGVLYNPDGSLPQNDEVQNDAPLQPDVPDEILMGVASEQAINDVRDFLLSMAVEAMEAGEVASWDDLVAILEKEPLDGTESVGLPTDEQIDLITGFADQVDLTLPPITPSNLRSAVEGCAGGVISILGRQRAESALLHLHQAMQEAGLRFDEVQASVYGSFPHAGEVDQDPFTIYQYRNIEEPGNHVDVYEYREEGITVSFVRHVDA